MGLHTEGPLFVLHRQDDEVCDGRWREVVGLGSESGIHSGKKRVVATIGIVRSPERDAGDRAVTYLYCHLI